MPCALRLGAAQDGFGGAASVSTGCGPIDELDERHRRVVADAKAHLQDPRVAARTRLVARADLGEQLGDDGAIAQAVEREAAVGERRLLGRA